MSGVEERERLALIKQMIRDLGDMACIGCDNNTCPACNLAAHITNEAHLLAQPTADEAEGDEREAKWRAAVADSVAARAYAGLRERVEALHGGTHWCFGFGDGDQEAMQAEVYEPGTAWWPCPTLAALAAGTPTPAQFDRLQRAARRHRRHLRLGAEVAAMLAEEREQATQEADRRVAEVVAAVEAEVFSENASAVLHGVTGTHPGSYGGVSKDEALECAADLIERVRGILTNFRSEVTGGGGDG